ncbi:conserved hypothetical protein [Paraburkholderia tropica]
MWRRCRAWRLIRRRANQCVMRAGESAQRQSAVDVDGLAGDMTRGVGKQEGDQFGDIGGIGHAAQRRDFGGARPSGRVLRRGTGVLARVAGRDAIHAHAVRCEFGGGGFRERFERGLRGGRGRERRVGAIAMRDERTHRHHASARRAYQRGLRPANERRERRGHRGEGGAERIGVECGQRLALRVARVGDELIERAEAFERGVDQMRGGFIGEIGKIGASRRADRAARFARLRDIGETGARGRVGAACVQHQRHAWRGEPARERRADAGARARDQDDAFAGRRAAFGAHAATRSSGEREISSVSW